jgi:serpin B
MLRPTAGLLTLTAALCASRPAAEPPAQKAEASALVQGNTAFALDLYGKLSEKEGNLFCSPFSLSAALSMTSAGARGKTLDEMARVLHLPAQEKLHPAFKALLAQVNAGGKGYQLSSANRLWGQKGFPFLPEFLALTRDNYGAGLQEVDFAGATEEARQKINAWVEKETNDKIKELLKQGVLNSNSRLVLTNAIYFKGDWVSRFKKERTEEAPFTLADGKKVQAPLMRQDGPFDYADEGTFQALQLPYVGKDLSMVVLLPKKLDGIGDLEKALTPKLLDAVLARLHPAKVEVALPKFKMTSEFSLGQTLGDLGMPTAFGNAANFSGIDGKEDLFISAVVHKAFVEVNEEGTEAAAASGVVVELKSEPPPRPVFRADHPFVFLIRDNRTGSILFLGRLSDPMK